MRFKDFEGRSFEVGNLRDDIQAGSLRGVHFHSKGEFDSVFDVIELVIGRGRDYTYAIEVLLRDGVIQQLRRVKFQAMCGGWRGKDHELKRFPVALIGENATEKILRDYLAR